MERAHMLKAVGVGQALAALTALNGMLSVALVNKGVSLPATQSVLYYASLALIYESCLLATKQGMKEVWWKYACLALSECIATFSTVTAYKHTSLTSVVLLQNCFTIPCVLIFSQLFLRVTYNASHWLGAGLCLLGLGLLVLTDHSTGDDLLSPNPVWGDSLVIFAAVLYSGNTVAQEKILGTAGKLEFLTMAGVFGLIFGGILALAVERENFMSTHWSAEVVGLVIGFDAASFAFATLAPFALIWGGATLFNLSLLASEVWAALARVLFFGGFTFGQAVSLMSAFVIVGAGVLVYSLSGEAQYVSKYQRSALNAEQGHLYNANWNAVGMHERRIIELERLQLHSSDVLENEPISSNFTPPLNSSTSGPVEEKNIPTS